MGNEKTKTPEKSGFLKLIKTYREEFIIAVTTTMVMSQIPIQNALIDYIKKMPELTSNPDKFNLYFHLIQAPLPQIILYLLIPLATILLLGDSIKKYGFKIGDYKTGLFWTILCIGVLAPLLYWSSGQRDFAAYYKKRLAIGFGLLAIQYGLYMFSWEFLFRGYMYFPLEERVGPILAIFIQSIPFAVAHLGKPAAEAVTCYFGGLVLGYISYKSRSFIYAFLIHWGIYLTLLGFIALRASAF